MFENIFISKYISVLLSRLLNEVTDTNKTLFVDYMKLQFRHQTNGDQHLFIPALTFLDGSADSDHEPS